MDRRRRQYVPMSVYLASGTTGQKLLGKFGLEGLAVWAAFLCACKTNWIQGQFTYAGEEDGWSKLGIYPHQPESFTLKEFFDFTGQLKQTKRVAKDRHSRGTRVADVRLTHWEEWNIEVQREMDAGQKASKRGQNTGTKRGQNGDDTETLGGTEVEGEDDEETRARGPLTGPPRAELQQMGLLRAVQ